jgi:hypothetical protein
VIPVLGTTSRIVAVSALIVAGSVALTAPTGATTAPSGPRLSTKLSAQLDALDAEKAGRTPAQRKIDSHLLFAEKKARGVAFPPNFPDIPTDISVDARGQVVVEVTGQLTTGVLRALQGAGGHVVQQVPGAHTLRARVPLTEVEALAASPDVRFVAPPAEPSLAVGDVTSEGDVTHRANTARSNFGVNGAGVKVGVLSDGVDSLDTSQSTLDLGAVTVLPGQAGSGDEGTAMLEIVHDVAPGAQLYFATAFTSAESFAQNIRALRTAGCDIIVDDVTYYNEGVFQDGPIAQAVNDVTSDGALYFSSAGNSGNLDDGTSGVWEGDFTPFDDGSRVWAYFGPGQWQNPIAAGYSTRPATLKWADPLGASSNDYDLYLFAADGTSVVDASTGSQTGGQDPYERVDVPGGWNNRRLAVRLYDGVARFLHLNTNRGRFDAGSTGLTAYETSGVTYGHNAAAAAFTVAATPAHEAFDIGEPAGPYPGTFSGTDVSETFTSDGPRRMFYAADGTPYTPGDFTATGGTVLSKPDLTAADGVATTVPGFQPFYGTSAAAPHAAAIAALLLDVHPGITPAEVRTALTSTAIDIEAPGWDRDTGAGIIDADSAVYLVNPGVITFLSGTKSVAENVGTVSLTVMRGGKTTSAASVHYARTGGTAAAADYSLPPAGTLSFAAGQTSRTIPLTIVNDPTPEAAETIVVTLSKPDAGSVLGTRKSMTVTIRPSDQRPDGLISNTSSSGYVGNKVYNTTAANQTRTQSAHRSTYRDFYVRVQNDGNATNTIVVKGSAAVSGSTVRYYYGSTNITTAMRSAAGYKVTLAAGNYRQLRVRISVGSAAAFGSLKPAKVTATWTGDGSRIDVVKAVVKIVR